MTQPTTEAWSTPRADETAAGRRVAPQLMGAQAARRAVGSGAPPARWRHPAWLGGGGPLGWGVHGGHMEGTARPARWRLRAAGTAARQAPSSCTRPPRAAGGSRPHAGAAGAGTTAALECGATRCEQQWEDIRTFCFLNPFGESQVNVLHPAGRSVCRRACPLSLTQTPAALRTPRVWRGWTRERRGAGSRRERSSPTYRPGGCDARRAAHRRHCSLRRPLPARAPRGGGASGVTKRATRAPPLCLRPTGSAALFERLSLEVAGAVVPPAPVTPLCLDCDGKRGRAARRRDARFGGGGGLHTAESTGRWGGRLTDTVQGAPSGLYRSCHVATLGLLRGPRPAVAAARRAMRRPVIGNGKAPAAAVCRRREHRAHRRSADPETPRRATG